MPDQPEFSDKLSDYIRRIEEAELRVNFESGIITSEDFDAAPLSSGTVERRQIYWRLYQHNMFYVVKVAAKAYIPKHHHDEDIFRLVIKGSLKVNGRDIKEGVWVVVKANTPYEIETEHGYTVMVGYRNACIAIN